MDGYTFVLTAWDIIEMLITIGGIAAMICVLFIVTFNLGVKIVEVALTRVELRKIKALRELYTEDDHEQLE